MRRFVLHYWCPTLIIDGCQCKIVIVLCYFQQLRAQVPVLKKAVLDEQANEEQLKVICFNNVFLMTFS